MRILVVSQYYWPEPFNVADICEELVLRGHEVTVLTGFPNYPEGKLYPGYEHMSRRIEKRNGVSVVRVPLHPRGEGVINRFLNYETFSRRASREARKLDAEFDLTFAYEVSPVMSASPALAYAKKHDVPAIIYVLDIWPECLLSGGVSKDSLIYRYYKRVSQRIYSGADGLLLSSPGFQKYLEGLPISDGRYRYLPQYAEDLFTVDSFAVDKTLLPEGYEQEGVDITFAGNVGAAQSVDTLIRASALFSEGIRLHIVGSGSELNACKRVADELGVRNVFFHGRRELSEMPTFYAASDALVVSFADDPVIGYTLPRKVQTYLAAGRPILGSVVGEARRVIEEAQCGICAPSEDTSAFAEVCNQFARSLDAQRCVWATNAREYYNNNFARQRFFDDLEDALRCATEDFQKEIANGRLQR